MQTLFLPGTNRIGNRLIFGCEVKDSSECTLRFFDKAGGCEDIPMEQVPFMKGCFMAELSFSKYKGKEYLYVAGGRAFVDPYARRVTGREVFGEKNRELRGVADFGVMPNDDKAPGLKEEDIILYELQVRGYTKHESSGVREKGTYLGLMRKIPYISSLGVTAVLLMPTYEYDEKMTADIVIGRPANSESPAKVDIKSRINYWGYGANAFYFAPKASFAYKPEDSVSEFMRMVAAFHKAGIEVFLDMDFTAEVPNELRYKVYEFWHQTYHIDGFRVSGECAPIELKKLQGMSNVKFVMNNDGFLYDYRRFLKADEGMTGNIRFRMFEGGKASGNLNYITSHNGFTLSDLYSYDVRHNEDNGEHGSDGNDYNMSWNCGVEGDTKSKRILALRDRMCRNAMTALLLGRGTPMLLAGDEFLNSKRGNNNSYCQDNEVSWLEWKKDKRSRSMREFVTSLIALRRSHNVLHSLETFRGQDYGYKGSPDISFHGVSPWSPDYSSYSRVLAVMMSGKYALKDREAGSFDDSFYIAYNCHWEDHEFILPASREQKWELAFSTATDSSEYDGSGSFAVKARSIAVFISRTNRSGGSSK